MVELERQGQVRQLPVKARTAQRNAHPYVQVEAFGRSASG
jgi:hypothetical protein